MQSISSLESLKHSSRMPGGDVWEWDSHFNDAMSSGQAVEMVGAAIVSCIAKLFAVEK
jgi:hypothetical protein